MGTNSLVLEWNKMPNYKGPTSRYDDIIRRWINDALFFTSYEFRLKPPQTGIFLIVICSKVLTRKVYLLKSIYQITNTKSENKESTL